MGYLLGVEWSLQRDTDGVAEVCYTEDNQSADLAPGEVLEGYHINPLYLYSYVVVVAELRAMEQLQLVGLNCLSLLITDL